MFWSTSNQTFLCCLPVMHIHTELGIVLSHRMQDGSECPTDFGPRSLTEVERKYSQIEREALACVFGVTRLYNYLFAKCSTLQMDHKPLLSLFNEHKGVPSQALGRMQRWALPICLNMSFPSSPQLIMVTQT